MPAIVAVLLSILAWARGLIVVFGAFALKIFSAGYIAHILIGLGFGAITYTGVDVATSAVISFVQSNMTGVTGALLQLVTKAGIISAMNMILSAHVSGIAFMTTVGVFKRFGWKGT